MISSDAPLEYMLAAETRVVSYWRGIRRKGKSGLPPRWKRNKRKLTCVPCVQAAVVGGFEERKALVFIEVSFKQVRLAGVCI